MMIGEEWPEAIVFVILSMVVAVKDSSKMELKVMFNEATDEAGRGQDDHREGDRS